MLTRPKPFPPVMRLFSTAMIVGWVLLLWVIFSGNSIPFSLFSLAFVDPWQSVTLEEYCRIDEMPVGLICFAVLGAVYLQRILSGFTRFLKFPFVISSQRRSRAAASFAWSLLFFLIAAAVGSARGHLSLPAWIAAYVVWMIILNLLTIDLYEADKLYARHNESGKGGHERRIPEKDLIGMHVLGGFLGGTIAMCLFEHKVSSRKQAFRISAILAVFVHFLAVAGVLWICSRVGPWLTNSPTT